MDVIMIKFPIWIDSTLIFVERAYIRDSIVNGRWDLGSATWDCQAILWSWDGTKNCQFSLNTSGFKRQTQWHAKKLNVLSWKKSLTSGQTELGSGRRLKLLFGTTMTSSDCFCLGRWPSLQKSAKALAILLRWEDNFISTRGRHDQLSF